MTTALNSVNDMEESSMPVNFYRYWVVVKERLLVICLAAVVLAGLAFLFFSSLTPMYKSSGTIMIEESNLVSNVADDLYRVGFRTDQMRIRAEVLYTEQIARRVVNKLELTKYPELNPYHPSRKQSFSFFDLFSKKNDSPGPLIELSEKKIAEATARQLLAGLSVSVIPGTPMVRVSMESSNPELAAMIVNGIADAYIESELDSNLEVAKFAAVGMTRKMLSLKQKVESSGLALQNFMEKNDLIERNLERNSAVSGELDRLSERLQEARAVRVDWEASYASLKKLSDMSYESLAKVPVILKDSSVNVLIKDELEARMSLSSLSLRYGPKHPKLIAATLEYESVKSALLDRMKVVANSIAYEYRDSLVKEKTIQKEYDLKRTELKKQNKLMFELEEYKRDYESNQELYRLFFERVRETTEFGDLMASNARLISPAVAANFPFKPKVKLFTAAVFAVVLCLGVILVILVELLDSTVKGPEDVENKLKHPLLAVIPLIDDSNTEVNSESLDGAHYLAKAFVEGSNKRFVESIRTLRTSVTLAGLKDPAKVILITSTVASEGKTTMSANLAEAYGRMEKTILIDADMRRPSMAKSLGISPSSKGLSNAVAYPSSLDECIHHLSGLGVDVIPSGPMPPNPLELLSSRNFEEILNTLRGRYERIIIDSAPAKIVSDALYLSSLVDGIIYVVKADSTQDRIVSDTINKFYDANARVIGVLLNQFDAEKAQKYSSDSAYGDYYEEYGVEDSKV